jgi:hypothetical protein
MTCGLAVKRPYDYEAYLLDESETGDDCVEIKRSRQLTAIQPQCSPFRPQMGTLASSLPQLMQSAGSQTQITPSQPGPATTNIHFDDSIANRCRLSPAQLETYLKAEVQYLRRRKLIPKHNNYAHNQSQADSITNQSSVNEYRSGMKSPSSCNSGSDSEGEGEVPVKKSKQLVVTSVGASSSSQDAPNASDLYDCPQFSLRHVKMICERLLNEQARSLRFEYEAALSKKLEEQHELYLQFTREIIKEKEQTSSSIAHCSYLS